MQSYQGTRAALGTMHSKERAIAPPFLRILGINVLVPRAIDTDAFGTFTGDIERKGTMLDAARDKARLAMKETSLPFGVASEGSYGPHPYIPFIPGGTELVLFIDDERGIEVKYSFALTRTNYDTVVVSPGDDIELAFSRMKFPSHCLTVRPNKALHAKGIVGSAESVARYRMEKSLFKGLANRFDVINAIEGCSALSEDGKALLVPDMRAHFNPTRMAMIRVAASGLARGIATPCPSCALPGFGIVDVARGLPCSHCGMPTQLAIAEIHRCNGCGHEARKTLRPERERADPGQCEYCNP